MLVCARMTTADAWPRFDLRPTDRHPTSQVGFEGYEIRLSAQASADSADETIYEWWKDGQPLPQTNRTSLVISNLAPEDSGVYFAIASNESGRAISEEARVEVVCREPLPGQLDPSFQGVIAARKSDEILGIAVDSIGRVLVVGEFDGYGLSKAQNIVRLRPDGTIDTEFDVGTGANASIRCVAVTGNSVWIGGSFTEFNGTTCQHLLRLQDDGDIGPGFLTVSGPDSDVRSILEDSNGSVVVGGTFKSIGQQATGNLARVDRNGQSDPTFSTLIINDTIEDMVRDAQGRMVLVGSFTDGGYSRIARLDSNGNIDSSFFRGTGSTRPVFDVAIQSDGAILIGGLFSRIHGERAPRLARLLPDGALDDSFGIDPDDDVEDIAVDGFDRIIVSGGFGRINEKTCPRIARVLPTAELDESFVAPVWDGEIKALAITHAGEVLAGGEFDEVAHPYVMQLLSDRPTNLPGTILCQPQDWSTVFGGVARFSVVASTSSNLSYQWFYDDQKIDGANKATLDLYGVKEGQAGLYHCTITSGGSQNASDRARLTVRQRRAGEAVLYQFGGARRLVGQDISRMAEIPVLESAMRVDDEMIIGDLDVSLTLDHGDTSTLRVALEFEPDNGNSVTVQLYYPRTPGGAGFFRTTFDDESNARLTVSGLPPFTGSFAPSSRLDEFDNASARGTWRLQVFDGVEDGLFVVLKSWELQVTEQATAPSYENWATGYFDSGSPPLATADSDGDGVENLLDYLTGRKPLQPLPIYVQQSNGSVNFRQRRNLEGYSLVYEVSSDLSLWQAIQPYVTVWPGQFQEAQLRSENARNYFRMRVE
ncbi:MAG: putative delta-60 repeat protein [Verrucomicrobiales bacterium]|jgi:uncharacterized delta-60 repeat protein